MEWKPIETAPKDGSAVLLWATRLGWENTGFCRVAGYYYADEWNIYGAGGAEPCAGANNIQRLDGHLRPTHWMELPPPPQEQTNDS